MLENKIKEILLRNPEIRIVFFFDPNKSRYEEFQNLKIESLEKIEIDERYFSLKNRLEYELKDQKVILYHPFKKPVGVEWHKYPLLGLYYANKELLLDDVGEFMQEYGLPQLHEQLVRKYIRQLKTKNYQRKLAGILEPSLFNESNLKQGFVSVLLKFNRVTEKNLLIARLFELTLNPSEFEDTLAKLRTGELEEEVCKWLFVLFGSEVEELEIEIIRELVNKFKYNLLLANINETSEKDPYAKLKSSRISEVNRMLSLMNDWRNDLKLKESFDLVMEQTGSVIDPIKLITIYGYDREYGYYSDSMVNEIFKHLLTDIEDRPAGIKVDALNWIENIGRNDKLSCKFNYLFHHASFLEILDSCKSFVFDTLNQYVEKYTSDLYKIDYHYRKAVKYFNELPVDGPDTDTETKNYFQLLNERYDRFLIELNVEWQRLSQEKEFDYNQINIKKQFNFYHDKLKQFDAKVAVIISDALRYEVAYELYEELIRDVKNKVNLEPMMASIPSITSLGMANLLPNKGIEINIEDKKSGFTVNNISTSGLDDRKRILKQAREFSEVISFNDLITFDRDRGRDLFNNNRIVYIYHDAIDAIGDKRRTEQDTFMACEKAIDELKSMIAKLYGWNVYHVLITADHGFIYNYNAINESQREDLPEVEGKSDSGIRYIIGEKFEGEVTGYQFPLANTTNIKTKLGIVIPRAINRYKKSGDIGLHFVHGGGSLQEIIIPFIRFYKKKEEIAEIVEFRRLDSTKKITTGSLKISIYQEQPVSSDIKPAEIIIGLYDEKGKLISNEVEVILESTSDNPKERTKNIVLTLSGKGSQSSFCYLRAFDINDKTRLNPIRINDKLIISTVMDIDEFQI